MIEFKRADLFCSFFIPWNFYRCCIYKDIYTKKNVKPADIGKHEDNIPNRREYYSRRKEEALKRHSKDSYDMPAHASGHLK